MPYYHTKDNGKVNFFRRKCEVCGTKWSIWSYFLKSMPKGIYWKPKKEIKIPELKLNISKGKTSYAKWADNNPSVALVASRLPNWPRWARVLSGSIFIFLVIFIFWLLYRFIRGF